MSNAKLIVATRKISEDIKNKVTQYNINIIDYDFLSFTYFVNEFLGEILINFKTPIIFTSKHAITAVLKIAETYGINLIGKSCYCVEGKTFQFAKQNGFLILAAANNSENLAKKIVANLEEKVFHFASNITLNNFYNLLKINKIEVVFHEVYFKKLNEIKVEENFDAVLFFSPSQINAFLLKNKLNDAIPAFCIGETTSSYLKALNHKNIITSQFPSEENLISEVIEYYKNT